jgi:tRNA(fMet)-specific endonuclease VapC
MILDTCFIIDLMIGDDLAKQKLQEIFLMSEDHYISTLVIFELFSGVTQSLQAVTEKQKVKQILQNQLILPFDQKSAEIAGSIFGNQVMSGKMTTVVDAMLAGIAKSKNQLVLTRNIKDFARIDGVVVESY